MFDDQNSNESNSNGAASSTTTTTTTGGGGANGIINMGGLFDETDTVDMAYGGEMLVGRGESAYKIRLEQQKMFLLLDTGEVPWQSSGVNSTSSAETNSTTTANNIIEPMIECMKEEPNVIPPAPPMPPSFLLQQQQQSLQQSTRTITAINNHMQIDPNLFITVRSDLIFLELNHQKSF